MRLSEVDIIISMEGPGEEIEFLSMLPKVHILYRVDKKNETENGRELPTRPCCENEWWRWGWKEGSSMKPPDYPHTAFL